MVMKIKSRADFDSIAYMNLSIVSRSELAGPHKDDISHPTTIEQGKKIMLGKIQLKYNEQIGNEKKRIQEEAKKKKVAEKKRLEE